MDKSKLTLEHTLDDETRIYSIEVDSGDLVMDAFIRDMIRPLCLAAGFHPNTVGEYLYQE